MPPLHYAHDYEQRRRGLEGRRGSRNVRCRECQTIDYAAATRKRCRFCGGECDLGGSVDWLIVHEHTRTW